MSKPSQAQAITAALAIAAECDHLRDDLAAERGITAGLRKQVEEQREELRKLHVQLEIARQRERELAAALDAALAECARRAGGIRA